MDDFSFTIESLINADKQTVWKHVTQMKNINAELAPFMRMTYPEDRSEIDEREIPMHETLFKSYILLFGIIPVDIHSLSLDKIEMGTAFYENSTSLTQRYWKHTRSLSEQDGKTCIRDEIHFLPRFAPMGKLLLPFMKTIFENRHKNLRKVFP